jgi:predicted RNase H-like HicB family nuclease
MSDKTTFNLTAILVQDKESKGFTGFFAQFPNIVAEGDTEDQAMQNLMELVQVVFEHQKEEKLHSPEFIGMNEVTTRSLQFAIA